jgi:hypothetical protein
MKADSTRWLVHWSEPLTKLAGRNVQLKFYVRQASLYSFAIDADL